MQMRITNLVWALAILCAGPAARAEQTRFYNLEGFGSWLDGNPESTAVTEDGEIILGSAARERFAEPAVSFSAATALGEDIVVSRLDDGRVLAIDRAGKSRELYKAKEQLITALAASGNTIYVAAGPPARIYKIVSGQKATTVYESDADFVWDMAVNGDVVYAVTGQPARVVKITSAKKEGEVLFEPEQSHLRSLAFDPRLGLFVGGGERGILYRALPNQPKTFRALFDSGHPEITAIVLKDNQAYVAGVTGAQALAADDGGEAAPGKAGKGPEVRSQLARVEMDGTAEILAGSNDEAIFDVAVDSQGFVVVATGATGRDDPRGRLYTVEPKQRLIAMVYQSASRRITHLVNLPNGALGVVAAGGGRIAHLAGGVAPKGEFLTTPFDTVINSKFGIMQIFADIPKGTKVTAAVRSGQTAKPDENWTAWSEEMAAPGDAAPKVENGRYTQLRLTLHGSGAQSPRVSRVRLAYMRQNLRPFVREVVALKKGYALLPVMREDTKTKSISLTDKATAEDQRGDGKEGKTQNRARQVPEDGALTVRWVAEDPNGDDLKYDLELRGPGSPTWRTVEDDLEQPFFTLHSSQLPDGHYQFRVRASDSPSNPEGREQSDTRESQAILVDNTPPRVDPLKIEVTGRRVTVRTVVADAVGPLIDAGYSLDGGPFKLLATDDGVLDGPGESFTLRLGELPAGPHSVTVRVQDEGENAGFGESSFVVK